MAAPITHIVLTEKVYKQEFSQQDKKEFFVGTLFPDIRYLGVIQREKTHQKTKTIEEIQKMDSFESGVSFHHFVDVEREKYLQNHGAYDLIPKTNLIITSLKLFEDEILYKKNSNWQEDILFFADVLDQEIAYGVKQEEIQKWHQFLSEYFSQKPNDKLRERFILALGFSKDDVKKINVNVGNLKVNNQLIGIIKNFYNNFEEIIKK